MRARKRFITAMLLLMIMCVGCNKNPTMEENPSSDNTDTSTPISESNMNDSAKISASIHVFAPEDMIVTPEINEYDFASAQEAGTLKTMRGMLPGATEGIWYIVEVDGIEYYYGKYDNSEEITLWGYSIISKQYSLENGLSVEMTKDEVLSEYPNMAIVEFEEDKTLNGVIDHSGWNGVCYPRSYIGMDNEWEYAGKDYLWTDQFDYVMIADIDLGKEDALPKYIALLMKNDVVTAITFYYPTAG